MVIRAYVRSRRRDHTGLFLLYIALCKSHRLRHCPCPVATQSRRSCTGVFFALLSAPVSPLRAGDKLWSGPSKGYSKKRDGIGMIRSQCLVVRFGTKRRQLIPPHVPTETRCAVALQPHRGWQGLRGAGDRRGPG